MLNAKFWCTTLLLLSSLIVFSQSAIPEPEVKLKRSRAIAVVKDLTRYDSLQLRFRLLEENNDNLKKVIGQKDEKISEYRDSESRLNMIIGNFSAIQRSDKIKYSQLEKKYRKEVRAGRFKLVLAGGAIAFALYKTFQ